MNARCGLWLPLILAGCVLPSCISVIAHNEQAAAAAATRFAQTAFVQKDYAAAYGLLSREFLGKVAQPQLADIVAKMHPKGYPTEIHATEFEPLPGQRGMVIYLLGKSSGEEFYYRFVLEGDSSAGYRVSGLFRGGGAYPAGNRRPLGS
jgi:hypothetical protein